jgi:hypothetical protein
MIATSINPSYLDPHRMSRASEVANELFEWANHRKTLEYTSKHIPNEALLTVHLCGGRMDGRYIVLVKPLIDAIIICMHTSRE